MIRTPLLIIFFYSGFLSAQGANGGAGNYQAINNTDGFCIALNREHPYFAEGICDSLVEQLRNDQCTAPLLEKLRKKLEATQSDNPPPNEKDQFSASAVTCTDRQKVATWKEIAKNKDSFGTIVAQLVASIVIAETNWDTFHQLEKGPGQNINAGKKGGLANLTLEQMENPKYRKGSDSEDPKKNCGCRNTNSRGSGAKTAWQEGDSPGPRDPHASVGCAAHILLVEAEEDSRFFSGQRQTNPPPGQPPLTPQQRAQDRNRPLGGAKVWDSLKDWQDPDPNRRQDPNDPDLANNPKLNGMLKKLRLYCERNMNDKGVMSRTFNEDFSGTTLRRGD